MKYPKMMIFKAWSLLEVGKVLLVAPKYRLRARN
jgi:hypothetical protein